MTYAEPINVFWETESSSFFSVIYGRVGYVCLEVLVAIFFFINFNRCIDRASFLNNPKPEENRAKKGERAKVLSLTLESLNLLFI